MNHGKSFSIQRDVCPRTRKLGGADAETRVGRELRSGTVRLSSYTSQDAKGEKENQRKLKSERPMIATRGSNSQTETLLDFLLLKILLKLTSKVVLDIFTHLNFIHESRTFFR